MLEDFEQYRPLLFSIAYRMLGSAMEAEDMVQEAYLRYQSAGPQTIRSPKSFLTTVVNRPTPPNELDFIQFRISH